MELDKINSRKKELGMTTDDLVEMSGISKGTLNKILSGASKNPKLETMQQLAKALDCTIDDFIDDSERDEDDSALSDKRPANL